MTRFVGLDVSQKITSRPRLRRLGLTHNRHGCGVFQKCRSLSRGNHGPALLVFGTDRRPFGILDLAGKFTELICGIAVAPTVADATIGVWSSSQLSTSLGKGEAVEKQ